MGGTRSRARELSIGEAEEGKRGSMGGTEQNLYRQIEASLLQVTAAVQRQKQVDLAEVTHLAGTIVDAIQ